MAEVSERHEVWVRRKDNNVVFAAERHKMAPKTQAKRKRIQTGRMVVYAINTNPYIGPYVPTQSLCFPSQQQQSQ